MSLRPQTAREALLEIRRLAATIAPSQLVSFEAFDEVAREGLERSGPVNFELSDQLADRLAEAHSLLGEMRNSVTFQSIEPGSPAESLFERMNRALSLPPDLESMVERRIGRH